MERGPKVTGAATALLIALPFGLFLAWSQPTRGPSRAELAAALSRDTGRIVAGTDIESIRCGETASVIYSCRWRQRDDNEWQDKRASLAASPDGWRVVQKTD